MITNLSENHEDTQLILNRGLTISDDKHGGLGFRGKGDSSLSGYVDNKKVVRSLCFLKYVSSCNQKTHFGTSPIKNWIYSGEWKMNYPNIYNIELN